MASESKESNKIGNASDPLLEPNNNLSSPRGTPSPNKGRITKIVIIFVIWLILAVVLPILLYYFTNIINNAITQFILSIGLLIPIVSLVGWQFLNNAEKATDKKIQIYSLKFENFYRYTGRALAVAVTFTSLAATLVLIGICFPTAGTLPWVVTGASVAFITILLYAVYLYVYKKSSFDDWDDLKLKIKASFFSSKENVLFFTLSIAFSITIALLISLDPAKLIAQTLWTAMLSTVLAAIAIFIVLRQFASFSLILLPHGKLDEQTAKLWMEYNKSHHLHEAFGLLETIKNDASNIPSDQILGLCNALANLPSNTTEKLHLLKWLANDPPYGSRSNLHYACEMLSFNPSLSECPIYIMHMCNGLRINGALERTNIFSTLPKERIEIERFEGSEAIKGALGASSCEMFGEEPVFSTLDKDEKKLEEFEYIGSIKMAARAELLKKFEILEDEAIRRHIGHVLAFLKDERLLTAANCEATIDYFRRRRCVMGSSAYTKTLESLSHIPSILKLLIKNDKFIPQRTFNLVIDHIRDGKVLASILDKISAIRNEPNDATKANYPLSLDSLKLREIFQQLTSIIQSDADAPPILNLLDGFLQKINDRTFFSFTVLEAYKLLIRRFFIDILLTKPYLLRFIKPEDFMWHLPERCLPEHIAARMQNLNTLFDFLNLADPSQLKKNYGKLITRVKMCNQYTGQLVSIADTIEKHKNSLTAADQISIFFETAEEAYDSRDNDFLSDSTVRVTNRDQAEAIVQSKIKARSNSAQADDAKILPTQSSGTTSTPLSVAAQASRSSSPVKAPAGTAAFTTRLALSNSQAPANSQSKQSSIISSTSP